jgi:hypothetical protein
MTDIHYRNADGLNSDPVSIAKPLPVRQTASAVTDASGAIASGSVAQAVFGAVPVNGYAIYNPDAANDLWISDTGIAAPNAAGAIRIAANGGGYETPWGYAPPADVSIVGPVTGQKFTAKRW